MAPKDVITMVVDDIGFDYCLKAKVIELVKWYEDEINIYKSEYHYHGSLENDRVKEKILDAFEIEG